MGLDSCWRLVGGKHRLRWTDGLDYARSSGVMTLALTLEPGDARVLGFPAGSALQRSLWPSLCLQAALLYILC